MAWMEMEMEGGGGELEWCRERKVRGGNLAFVVSYGRPFTSNRGQRSSAGDEITLEPD